jgi:hypothetical protein
MIRSLDLAERLVLALGWVISHWLAVLSAERSALVLGWVVSHWSAVLSVEH